jgi:hypothetical protein
MKRGESISMSVIIIAAIALLVLVILAVLVLKTGGTIKNGTGCQGIGGSCKASGGCDPNNEGRDFAHSGVGGDCPTDTPDCCVAISKAAID